MAAEPSPTPVVARRDDRAVAAQLVPGGALRLVLIAGTGLPGAYWKLEQTPALSAVATCLLVDNAGSGGTDPLPDGRWNPVEMAKDVLAAMDAAGWGRAHLAGHSLGTAIAVHAAHLRPERVSSLSLHCTWPGTPDAPHLRAWLEARQVTARIGDRDLWMRYGFFLVGPDHFAAHGRESGALGAVARLLEETGGGSHIGQYDAGLSYEARDILPTLQMPTLVTAGECDFVTLASDGRRTAEAIPGARYVELPRAGHMSALEAPELFNDVQQRFLLEVGA